MPTDPTMVLLDRFADESAWDHVDRGIPILKPHIGKHFNPISKQRDIVVDYTIERLQRMVKTNTDRCLNSASVPLMVLKHDNEDPVIVGYWNNFRMGTFGPSQKPAMLADRFFLPGTYEEGKKYPFRSIEFYPAEYCEVVADVAQPEDYDAITAVALLKTPPKLDMGLTVYARLRPVCYGMEGDDDVDPTTIPGVQPPPGAPPAPGAPGAPGATGSPANPAQDQIYNEFKPHFQRCMQEMYGGLDKWYAAECAPKYGMSAMAMPGPAVGGPPAAGGAKPDDKPAGGDKPKFPSGKEGKDKPPEKEQMSRAIELTSLAKLLDPQTYSRVEASLQNPPPASAATPPEAPASTIAPSDDKRWENQLAMERARYEKRLSDLEANAVTAAAANAARDAANEFALFRTGYEKDLQKEFYNGTEVVIPVEMAKLEKWTAKMSPADRKAWADEQLETIRTKYEKTIANRQLGSINGAQIIPDSRLNQPSADASAAEYDPKADGMVVVHYQESLGWGSGKYEQAKAAVVAAKPEAVKYQKANPHLDWEKCVFAVLGKKSA
jgi:hypothetical protein